MSTRIIDVLFFDGCPNVDSTLARVRSAAIAANVPDVEVRFVRVETEDEAKRVGFLGSPSVRVDGDDVELAARCRRDFALQCRVYPTERGGLDGAPPVEWIRAALLGEAASRPLRGGTTRPSAQPTPRTAAAWRQALRSRKDLPRR